ncbi:hypothetical protein TWF730_001879 [Orbilia blumenaviensis]|uniref:Uncharacterized protein n=1 Tax=Orbilia blumenaviensis TaxID=1796055 RepID=A0AAV9UCB4_9PEZI
MPPVIYWGKWVESDELNQVGLNGFVKSMLSRQPSILFTIPSGTENIIPNKRAILELSTRRLFRAPCRIRISPRDINFPQVATARVEINRTIFANLIKVLKAEREEKLLVVRQENTRQETVFQPLLARGPGTLHIYTSDMKKSQRIERLLKSIGRLDKCIQSLTKAMAETIVMSIRQAGMKTSEPHFNSILNRMTKSIEDMDTECGTNVMVEIGDIFPPEGIFIAMEQSESEGEGDMEKE